MVSDSIDTNMIIRLIEGDNPSQRKKVIEFLNNPGPSHRIDDIALSEAVYVLESIYDYSRERVIDKLNFFLAQYSGIVKYNRKLTSHVFPFYLAHPSVSFNDCCLAFYAHKNHAEPLFTFDQKLAAQHPSAKLLK